MPFLTCRVPAPVLCGLASTAALPLLLGLFATGALAQAPAGWQACAAEADDGARLACYDRLARDAAPASRDAPPAAETRVTVPAVRKDPEPARSAGGCHDAAYSELSRFWELERATGCGVFGIRSYRPISLSVVRSNTINRQPTSENPLNNVLIAQPYRTTETRIQL